MLFGASALVLGYYLAKLWDTSIAGMMATTVGVLFVISLVSQKIFERRRKSLVRKLEVL
jgi:manganese/zinc/iron transport system permease protein